MLILVNKGLSSLVEVQDSGCGHPCWRDRNKPPILFGITGFHLMVPFLTRVEPIQVTIQTDQVCLLYIFVVDVKRCWFRFCNYDFVLPG